MNVGNNLYDWFKLYSLKYCGRLKLKLLEFLFFNKYYINYYIYV